MGSRRKGRELALQILYQIEMQQGEPKSALALLWRREEVSPEIREFTTQLVEGTYRNLKEIDQLIEKHSTRWKLGRMAVVDRNILRLAVYELAYLHEIPTSVVLNEAIEMGKKFGTEQSSAFINGVLDNIAKEIRK